MLYFSGMEDDCELWSGWVTALRERQLHEIVAWLIKAGKPAAILFSQMITITAPLITGSPSHRMWVGLSNLLEDTDQLELFSQALVDKTGNT
jgi:hypothetical protein